jgi:hypothetical protein
MREVSKIIVRVDGFAEPTQLMSVKKAKGTPKHKKLEILGGGTDGQDAFEALVRELEEEEKTGRLAEIVRALHPEPRSFTIADAPHHMYEVTIAFEDYLTIRADKAESFGFVVIPESKLREPAFQGELTRKTLTLLHGMGLLS